MEAISNIKFKGNVLKSYVSETITDETLLNKAEADALYVSQDYSYDWSPGDELRIGFTMTSGSNYTAPCNGWLIKNPDNYSDSWSISINGNTLLTSDDNGQISAQVILSKDDVVSSTTSSSRSCLFIPCRSEEADYREDNLRAAYDIWKGAVIQQNGNYIVRDQYIPNASSWNSEHKNTFINQLNHVHNGEGHTGECDHLFYIQSENIEKANNLFNGMLLSYIEQDFPILYDGLAMCIGANNLHTFRGSLESLENGNQMFMNCPKLTTFDSNLDSLINGPQMFQGTGVTTFTTDLPELINSNQMFDGSKLTSWTVDMPKLKSGSSMFRNNPIASFRGNTPMLQTSENMFSGCSSLTSWSGDLSELMTGYMMFQGASLNAESVANIANTIKNISSIDKNTDSNWEITTGYSYSSKSENRNVISADWRGRIDIGVNASLIEDDAVKDSCDVIIGKGWVVYLNGTLMENVIFNIYKYNDCVNSSDLLGVNINYRNDLNDNNVWTYYVNNLADGSYAWQDLTGTSKQYNIVAFKADMPKLTNATAMFAYSTIANIASDMPELINATSMFQGSNIKSFTNKSTNQLEKADMMFANSDIETCVIHHKDIGQTSAKNMFYNCDKLTSCYFAASNDFTSSEGMFHNCHKLKGFKTLAEIGGNNTSMFYNCYALTACIFENGDGISSADDMFKNCYNLIAFRGNFQNYEWPWGSSSSIYLTTLGDYNGMFSDCKLFSPSVSHILNNIGYNGLSSSLSSSSITIGLGYPNDESSASAIATRCGYGSIGEVEQAFRNLNWNVNWQWNGRPEYWGGVSALYTGASSNFYYKFAECTSYNELASKDWSVIPNTVDAWYYQLPCLQSQLISNLVGMFKNKQDLYQFFADMPYLTDGRYMFQNSGIKEFNGALTSMDTGYDMFAECNSLVDFNSHLSSLKYGARMFYNCTALSSFDCQMPILEYSSQMFSNTALTEFHSELPLLYDGRYMFYNCLALESFTSDLSSLTNGEAMFNRCGSLTSFDPDLSSLTRGLHMFANCTNLTTFDSDLSSLTDGYYMFSNSALTSFTSDLSSLTHGQGMFRNTNLTSFTSDLSSLTKGNTMFRYCELNSASVQNIASTINNLSDDTNDGSSEWGEIHIDIANSTPNPEEGIQLSRIIDKGWTVRVNGSPFSRVDHYVLKYNTYTTCADLAAAYPSYQGDIINGEWNYYLDNLTNGYEMFQYSALASFNSDLSSLTDGRYMFSYCFELTSFKGDLSNLTDGRWMFSGCSSLTSFDYDLSKLTDGYEMFSNCSKLTSFNADLSKLTNGSHMFYNCDNLALFDSDLPKLTNGEWMFRYCSALTTFNSNLSSLTSGNFMFDGCKLNTASVKNIASTINTVSSGSIHIGIGNSSPNSAESSAFNTIASKGWTVYVNGSSSSNIWTPTASTNLTDGEEEGQSTPIPFYAKPIQVTEEHAEYVDANNNYYNIVGAQFIYGDDISTYGAFTSFEHAESEIMTALNLTKIEKE